MSVGGAGEGALLVAEQLRLDQILGDRRAVDLDERALGARTPVVQGVGDELLAGAVLALDEHVGVARRHGVHQLEQLAHHLALADHRAHAVGIAELGPQLLVRHPLVDLTAGPLEDADDAVGIELRLLDEEEGAGLPGIERPGDRALAADDDHLGAGRALLHALEHVEAVAVRQEQIQQDDLGPPLVEDGLADPSQARRPHFERRLDGGLLDHHAQPVHRDRVVVHDQHAAPAKRNPGHPPNISPQPGSPRRRSPASRRLIRYNPPHGRTAAGAASYADRVSAHRVARPPRRQRHGLRALRGGDVPDARGVALPGLPVQDRLLRLVARDRPEPRWTPSSRRSAPRTTPSPGTGSA